MNYERLRESVKRHEGYRDLPYFDSLGFATVGYGHLVHNIQLSTMVNYRTVGNLLKFLSDKAQHDRWLESDILEAESDARRFIGDAFDKLSDVRQEVVVEMAFQLGADKLAKFVDFRSEVLKGRWGFAAVEMLDSLWAKQTPSRVRELADRMVAG